MQTTTNYELKKPDYTNFSDIQDLNDNMDTIDELLASPTGDTADSTVAFTSSDVDDASATSWTSVTEMTSGETHKSIFAKISQMFKNIRFLYKLLGNTDISAIGNGTVTGGLSALNTSLGKVTRTVQIINFTATLATTYDVDTFSNYQFILIELYTDATTCIATGITTPAAIVQNTFRVYGTSDSQWGEIKGNSYTSITLNRTSANTHHMRIVALGYGIW